MAQSHSSTGMARTRGARAAAFALGASLALAAGMGPARADKVGVAAAVNPDAFSSLSGTPNKQLNIGKSIFYNERINTTASGLVQVLLVDGSTFTVGPNSDLVIDKFVYDPKKKTGEMVATFSKGTMRFIGGKLSKNEGGVKVNTPAGALAIRGGMFQGSTSRGIYSFFYGHSLTFTGRNGQTQTIFQPGYIARPARRACERSPDDARRHQCLHAGSLEAKARTSAAVEMSARPRTPARSKRPATPKNEADQETSDANYIQVQTAIQEQLIRLANLPTNTPIDQPTPTGAEHHHPPPSQRRSR